MLLHVQVQLKCILPQSLAIVSFSLCRRHEELQGFEPEHLQASSVRGDQRSCQEKLHQGNRVLRVLQATTPPSVHGPEPKLITMLGA